MIAEEFQNVSKGGVSLSGKSWFPEEEPSAVICIVHGLGEHSLRYEHVAREFTKHGFGVYAIDLRGHGASEGKRGDGSIASMLIDIQELVITARREFNDLPLFLLGHSFGGLLTANYLIKMISSEISGAILSSPWLELAMPVPRSKYRMASVLKYLAPSFAYASELNPDYLANDKEVGRKYLKDPLVHDKISIRLFFDIKHTSEFVFRKADLIEIPILIGHGNDDRIISIAGSEKLAAKIPKSELKIWSNSGHEPHNDVEKEQVIGYYMDWIEKHIKKSAKTYGRA